MSCSVPINIEKMPSLACIEDFNEHDLWISEFEMLQPSACADWAERVMDLRAQWTARHVSLPFFTLGMAAYLDAVPSAASPGRQAPYYADVLRRHHNRMLRAHFGPLLELVCDALGRWAERSAHCSDETSSLPGFHIHLAHPVFTQPVASRHRDLQFQRVFPGRAIAPSRVLTFTLALSLPEGAGLNMWSGDQVHFHPYRLGHMAVHSGLLPHQAVLFPGASEQPRIMLQGHALIDDGTLLLYW
jgi:hypothetical protein